MALNLNYNALKKVEKPGIYLAYPSREILGELRGTTDTVTELYFNAISELNFKYYKYTEGVENELYDKIENLMSILMIGISWFQITTVEEYNDGNNPYKQIQCKSMENELCGKILTSFGQLGREDDEQGGLDRYALYSPNDPEHSILNIVCSECPSWSVGVIDSAITTQRRAIDEDQIDAYSLLTSKCSEVYKCIFLFNTFNRTISAYSLDTLNYVTSIYLSYKNLIKNTNFVCDLADVKTVLYVSGGDYQGYGNLTINACNPSGNNYISNFEYYYKMMSEGLVNKLKAYTDAYNIRLEPYKKKLASYQELLRELERLEHEPHKYEDEGNYSKYCLDELKTAWNAQDKIIAMYNTDANTLNGPNFHKTIRDEAYNLLYGKNYPNDILSIDYNLNLREKQIKEVQAKIAAYTIEVLSLEDFLTKEERQELDHFVIKDTYSDTSYVATLEMSDSEILEMKKELMADAEKELKIISQPSYTLTIDTANFLQIPEFRDFADELNLGCIITVDFDEKYMGTHYIQSRLLKAHINWDKTDDFSLEFGSRNNLDGKYAFEEVKNQAQSSFSSIDINHSGYNAAKNQTTEIHNFMNDVFTAAKNQLVNNENNEVVINEAGIRLKRWIYELNGYDDQQTWITPDGIFISSDNFKTVSVALGSIRLDNGSYIHGLNAEVVAGKFIIGETLYMQNQSGNLTFNDNGFEITNKVNSVKINPNDKEIFKISKDSKKLIYFDSEGNAHFEGKIDASIMESSTIKSSLFLSEYDNGTTSYTMKLFGDGLYFYGSNGNFGHYNDYYHSIKTEIANGCIYMEGDDPVTEIVAITPKKSFIYDLSVNTILTQNMNVRSSLYNSVGDLSIGSDINMNKNSLFNVSGISGLPISGDGKITFNGTTIPTYDAALGLVNASQSYLYTVISNLTTYDITPDITSYGNINFKGLPNGASTEWVDDHFQRKSDSDFRLKKEILSINQLDYKNFYKQLKPKSYRLKSEYKNNKVHFGLIANQLKSLFERLGYDYQDFDIIEERRNIPYYDDGQYTPNSSTHLAINYENLHALHISMIQDLDQRETDVEEKIDLLNEKLETLIDKLNEEGELHIDDR